MPKKTTKKRSPIEKSIEKKIAKGIENCGDGKSMKCGTGCGGCSGAAYGLGFLGAAIYYIANATSFWMGVGGFFKALIWPAFLVFELMKSLGM